MDISRCLDFLLFLIIYAYSSLHHFVIHALSVVHHNYIGHMRYRNELLFVTSLVLNFIIMIYTHTHIHTYMRVLSPLRSQQLDVKSVFVSLTIPCLLCSLT